MFHISAFTEFTVLENSGCLAARRGNLRWAKIQLDDGRTGWTAYGYSDGITWIEPVPGGGSNGGTQSPTEPTGTIEFSVTSPALGWRHRVRLDVMRCTITNGADVITWEIVNFHNWAYENLENIMALDDYFRVNTGYLEQFRHELLRVVQQHSNCQEVLDLRYQVGNRYMDPSGLGNIMFGYFMEIGPWVIEELIADVDQGFNVETLRHYWDMPDDRQQRRLGNEIAEEAGQSVTARIVRELADEVGLE